MEKIEEIKKLRNQLPDNWVWNKCYELGYVNSRTGREFVKKHWALTAPDGKGLVCSLGLISHDCTSNSKEFLKDIPVQWVEKSLGFIDYLLSEVDRLSNPSEFGLVKQEVKTNFTIQPLVNEMEKFVAQSHSDLLKGFKEVVAENNELKQQADKLAEALRDCIVDLQYYTSDGHSVGLSSIDSAYQTLNEYEK